MYVCCVKSLLCAQHPIPKRRGGEARFRSPNQSKATPRPRLTLLSSHFVLPQVSSPPTTPTPDPWIYTGVYDRHGGAAVADWLVKNLEKYVRREWQNTRSSPEAALTAAFLAADKKLLAPKAG